MSRSVRIRILMISIAIGIIVIFSVVSLNKRLYTGEYVEFGELLSDSNTTKKLKESNIPYKVEDNIIYIPEDAFDKAIYCCT